MDPKRRTFLAAFVPGIAVAGAAMMTATSSVARASQSVPRPQQQTTLPPLRTDRPPVRPAIVAPTDAQLRQNQRDIRKDVDQLFSLAQDLKNLAAKNDAVMQLSVNLIQKTEEIEKLAKKIRDLARS